MKIYSSILSALLILLVVPSASCIEKRSNDGGEALIVEYIPEFKVKIADVKNVITNQFSKFSIGAVKTSYATIDKAQFIFTYKNGSVPT